MLNIKAVPSDLYVRYKGKKYEMEYLGETKFGYRAKLKFLDGTKEFWVDGNLVFKYMTRSEEWDYIGEEEPSIYDVFDSHYEIDPDIGDH